MAGLANEADPGPALADDLGQRRGLQLEGFKYYIRREPPAAATVSGAAVVFGAQLA